MSNLQHPSSRLDTKQAEVIRNTAAAAEEKGHLGTDEVKLIHDQQWFKILTPSQYGGLQYSLPDALYLEEALAWADGSIGWTVTLCAGAGWFGGFTDTTFSKTIFDDPKVCVAGSGMTTGTAEKTRKGYVINGRWPHASGGPDATVFTANCIIMQNGKPLKDENNKDVVRSFLFLKEEVTLLNTWNTIGMVATSSNGYEVKNITVPEERIFKINDTPKIDAPLYNYPFLQLAETTLAVNISGMAIHFTDLCQKIFSERKNRDGELLINDHNVQEAYTKHTQKLNDARTKLFYAAELSWQACVNSKQIKEAILYKVSAASSDLAKRARECVDALYPYCGLAAADKNAEINRVWRDLHTASQHSLLVFGGSAE